MEQSNAITAENHNFLKDVSPKQKLLSIILQVVDHVLCGDGVGWLKLSRLRKLMEVNKPNVLPSPHLFRMRTTGT